MTLPYPSESPFAARLHHVGYVVPDIEAAARHFTDALGYVVESEAIPDPRQTARVQFLRLPGDSSWLELIAPLSTPSKLDTALRRGMTLHHLCYETDDIGATAASLLKQKYTTVQPPLPAAAFPGRRIAWYANSSLFLVELVEAGAPPLSARHLCASACSSPR